MEAEIHVLRAPQIQAEIAKLEISPLLLGARELNTPTWIPIEERLAKPQMA